MSTNEYDNNKGYSGTSMLNHRSLRLSIYMCILLCVTVPSCMVYGRAIDNDQCPTDDENARDCNATAAGYFILLFMILICGLFMWIIPNTNILSNKIAKIIIGILILISAIMIFVGVILSYDEMCGNDTNNNSNFCLLYVGSEWFVITHIVLLGIDIISDYGSDTNKRILSYSLMYLIGCCILFEPFFEGDNPGDAVEVMRAGLILIFIGCVLVIICCIVNIVQKRTIASNNAGQWFTRILALFFIVGAMLLLWGFDSIFGIAFATFISSTIGLQWVLLIGIFIHGYDVVSL
eukprot:84228_1